MKKRCAVIYLDLLGFKSFSNEDTEAALEVLLDFHTVLKNRQHEEQIRPLASIPNERLKRPAERKASDSFNYFLPMSDSIFILSEEPDKVAAQLSTFLSESFLFGGHAYAYSMADSSNPLLQPIKEFEIDESGTGKIKNCRETQYPVLFRGGISYGDVEAVRTPAIYKGKEITVPNVIGQGVVQAVSLEQKKLKGPRILCGCEFVSQLREPAIKKYLRKEGDVWELLWPGFNYLEDDDESSQSYELNKLFYPALALWKNFSGKPPDRHYKAFLELIVRSHLAFAKSASSPELVNEYLYQTLNKTGFELCNSGLNSQLVFPNTR